jgi:hypothetical protein
MSPKVWAWKLRRLDALSSFSSLKTPSSNYGRFFRILELSSLVWYSSVLLYAFSSSFDCIYSQAVSMTGIPPLFRASVYASASSISYGPDTICPLSCLGLTFLKTFLRNASIYKLNYSLSWSVPSACRAYSWASSSTGLTKV